VQLAVGAPCGDVGPATPCDLPDSCDDQGACLPNNVPDETPCGGGMTCITEGTCAGGGCAGSTNKAAGTPCGDPDPFGDCDAGDTCDDAGHCLPNLLDASNVCRPDAGVCEACDGASKGCPDDAFEPEGTPCGALDACTPDQCDAAGTCQPTHVECSTTTTTAVGETTTTTTLVPGDACGTLRGLAHAACLIDAMLAGDLCVGETVPPKLNRVLRARLTRAAARLDVAMASEGRKRLRAIKKVRAAVTAVGRKAAAAGNSTRSGKQISSSCASGLGTFVSAVQRDLS
jgi:hypothetical protein